MRLAPFYSWQHKKSPCQMVNPDEDMMWLHYGFFLRERAHEAFVGNTRVKFLSSKSHYIRKLGSYTPPMIIYVWSRLNDCIALLAIFHLDWLFNVAKVFWLDKVKPPMRIFMEYPCIKKLRMGVELALKIYYVSLQICKSPCKYC